MDEENPRCVSPACIERVSCFLAGLVSMAKVQPRINHFGLSTHLYAFFPELRVFLEEGPVEDIKCVTGTFNFPRFVTLVRSLMVSLVS